MTDDSGKQPIQRKSRGRPCTIWWRIAGAIVGLGGMFVVGLIILFIFGAIFGVIEQIIVNPGTGDLSQVRPFSWIGVIRVIAFLAAFGILWASSLALDARSGDVDMPWLRTVLGAGMGTLMVLSCWSPGEFGLEWFGAGALAGAFLGWLGERWAQIIIYVIEHM